MKKKQLSKREHFELWAKVDSEGFGYYMFDYGPDLDAIERLGFDRKELEAAISLLSRVQDKVMEGDSFCEDEEE